MSFNNLTIVGNVGADAEVKFTKDGQAIVSFNVAVNKITGKGDNRKSVVTWFQVTVWGEYGEALADYLRKGTLVTVTGEVSASAWIDQTGQARAGLQIKAADHIALLSSGRKSEDAGNGASEPASAGGHGYTDPKDIPF